MLRALIGVLCVLSLLHAPIFPRAWAESTQPITAPASEVFKAQRSIIKKVLTDYPGVTVRVAWTPCGMRNAFYYPTEHAIVLCTEMEEYPGVAVMFAAHEAGHAVTHQRIDILDEGAADELAAIAMVKAGLLKELLDSGLYYRQKWFQGHLVGDEHPSAGYRAWFFSCMGSVDTNTECALLYEATLLKWEKRLKSYV